MRAPLLIALAALGLTIAQSAIAAQIDTRMSLIEAIDETRRAGVEISYSTQLVKEWMRVRENPASADPVEALRGALAVYELGLEAGRNGGWLVVKSPRPTALAVPPEPEPEATPAKPEPELLEEIVIVASRHSMYDQSVIADHFLTGEEIRRLPHIADDAVRALHRLPGVAATDFSGPFNLRGGAIDEVKIVLDGVELVEPFHMQTLFSPLSIIDPGIIGRAEVLSGGFTADYGNHMSGVINIGSGIPDGPAAHEVGVSFVSAFARSQGQFEGERGSWFVSARRGYLDLVAEEIVAEGEELEPRFADLFAKVSWDLSDSATVSLQTLIAEDDVEFVDSLEGEDSREDSESQYVSVSLDAALGDRVESNTVLFGGNVETDQIGSHFDPPERDIDRRYSNRLRYAGLVICRQRPGTASGVVFMTLEDETGFVNLVVWSQVFERHAILIKTAGFLGVSGRLQIQDGVTHLIADDFWLPKLRDRPAPARSRDFH